MAKSTLEQQELVTLLGNLSLEQLNLVLKKARELLAEQTREERALSPKSAG